jgi:hypothetical protein
MEVEFGDVMKRFGMNGRLQDGASEWVHVCAVSRYERVSTRHWIWQLKDEGVSEKC